MPFKITSLYYPFMSWCQAPDTTKISVVTDVSPSLSNNEPIKLQFVCVEVLRPSQPNGVMLSAVSLPNHTFTGQA